MLLKVFKSTKIKIKKRIKMSKNKLIEFMQKQIPNRKSKIEILQYKKEEIFELHSSGYAIHQIVDYLKLTYKLITSRQTLAKFIKEELRK
jgi:hypothetical protein